MAIGIKSLSVGTNATNAASFNVVTSESPSATSVGDLVIVSYQNDFYALSNMGTPSATGTPTMNTITNGTQDGGSSTGVPHIKTYWYVANTSGAQTITVTETGTHDEEKLMFALVLSGADTTTVVDDCQGQVGAAGPTNTASAVTPAQSNSFLVVFMSNGANKSYTTPSPLTEQNETLVGGVLDCVLATNQLSASGSTGTFAFTPSGSVAWTTVSLAILTASGGGGSSATADPVYVLPSQAVQRSTTW